MARAKFPALTNQLKCVNFCQLTQKLFQNSKFDSILSKTDKAKFTSQMKETFGEYVRKLRTEKELTLTQLAAQLGIDSANLSKIETGKREFDERKLTKLSKIFKLEINSVKEEFYSEKIARKIYETNCSENTLVLAEQKVKYLKQKNLKQSALNL